MENKRFEVYNDNNFEEDEMIAYIGSEAEWKDFIANYPHTYVTVGQTRIENGFEIVEVWVGNEEA